MNKACSRCIWSKKEYGIEFQSSSKQQIELLANDEDIQLHLLAREKRMSNLISKILDGVKLVRAGWKVRICVSIGH